MAMVWALLNTAGLLIPRTKTFNIFVLNFYHNGSTTFPENFVLGVCPLLIPLPKVARKQEQSIVTQITKRAIVQDFCYRQHSVFTFLLKLLFAQSQNLPTPGLLTLL